MESGRFRKRPLVVYAEQHEGSFPAQVQTLNGMTLAQPGDWIITGESGERWPCKPEVFARTYAALEREPRHLTERELEVVLRIADGLTGKEIAARLGVTSKTVESHRTSAMRKWGAAKATQLVRLAIRYGYVEA